MHSKLVMTYDNVQSFCGFLQLHLSGEDMTKIRVLKSLIKVSFHYQLHCNRECHTTYIYNHSMTDEHLSYRVIPKEWER